MITYLDVETTFTIDENKRTDPLPFTPSNKLVSVQYACDDGEPQFHWFHHKDKTFDTKNSFTKVQQTLDNSQLLVGHNIKFDLVWL